MSTREDPRRAEVVGTGLIGGSVAAALRRSGWHVTGYDLDDKTLSSALEMELIDAVGTDPDAELAIVAVPVGKVARAASGPLERGAVVTDVGSVKAPVVAAVQHPNFVGGHPMAGSEALGVQGARAELFEGATWALTPTDSTNPDALALVHGVVRSVGAEVVTLAPAQHDRLVATVSHVPHLAAATLMAVADERASEHAALLRLAAGGFRDMTRIAAGDPAIWQDICRDNRDAILEVLDGYMESLAEMRGIVADGEGQQLLGRLGDAQIARRSLPAGAPTPEELVEVRIPVPDRPGELAAVTSLATDLGVNVFDIEVAHSAGSGGGLLILVVAEDSADAFKAGLSADGRHSSVHALGDST
ncbi:MAG: prephenate dehydrogenase/arogenate dehydrogenase family protein [Microthrixaceae bacterium]